MKKIIFVYNADSDLFSAVTDFAHKIISPKTYSCNLCVLTHGNFGMKKEWAEFIKTLQPPPEFLHKDEFIQKYMPLQEYRYPLIATFDGNSIELFIAAEELDQAKSIDELRVLIQRKQHANMIR